MSAAVLSVLVFAPLLVPLVVSMLRSGKPLREQQR